MIGFMCGLVVGLAAFLSAERYRTVMEAREKAHALRKKRLLNEIPRPHAVVTELRDPNAEPVRVRKSRSPVKVRRNF